LVHPRQFLVRIAELNFVRKAATAQALINTRHSIESPTTEPMELSLNLTEWLTQRDTSVFCLFHRRVNRSEGDIL
jgi:hypothetical protein